MANRPQENPTMLCDFYELTMGNGYYRNGFYKRNVYFDVFFRNVPDGGGFAIAAGLEQIVEYIQQLHFSDDDSAYLRSMGIFVEGCDKCTRTSQLQIAIHIGSLSIY